MTEKKNCTLKKKTKKIKIMRPTEQIEYLLNKIYAKQTKIVGVDG